MWKKFLIIPFAVLLLVPFMPFSYGGDPGITGLEVRDRERMFHRLKSMRMKRPADPELSYQIANLCYSLQMEDEAIKEYRRTLKLDPDNLDAKWFLSKVLSSKGYYEEAFTLVREIIEKKNDDPEAFLWAGEILLKLEQPEIAGEYFAICDGLTFKSLNQH